MNRKEEATALHRAGYNCAQAVICAFTDELGVDKKTAFILSEGFGLGCGCMEGQCGARSGAIMVAGVQNSDANLDAPKTKSSTYKLTKALRREFESRAGAVLCKDLKCVETGKMICSCPRCIEIGVEIAEEILSE